ncbi:MAG: Por Secre tail protein, partial [Bacteroidota bacterium]|nr:Por Secre tail protein [Bacteroidota bacterium]
KISNDNSKIYIRLDESISFYNPKPNSSTHLMIKVYDFNTLDSIDCIGKVQQYVYGGKSILGFEISHDGKMMAIRYGDNNVGIRIFNINPFLLIRELNISGYACMAYKFTNDDKYLLTAGNGSGYY